MCAYACRPARGSEPGIGWNWAEQASRDHEVWVLTHSANRTYIEESLESSPNPNLHFVYHTVSRWADDDRLRITAYVAWHLTAIPLARWLHSEHRFDLAHHVTYGALRYPSVMAWLGIPYALGPIGGAERAPLSMYLSVGFKGIVTQSIRNATSSVIWAIPLTRATFRNASVILVYTKKTRDLLPKWAQPSSRLVTAIGIKPQEREHPDNFDTPRVLVTGRLLYWKGNHFGLRAFAELKKRFPEARMSICGDGPEGKRLERICDELGIRASVDFLYDYDHQQALDLYSTHTVFLSPILHLSGFVVLEAMNAGMPVVELDTGDDMGPVTDETGIRVPMKSPDQVVRDLGQALCRLAGDPSLAKRMGKAGQRRIRDVYDWNLKADVISRLYEDMARR